MNGFISKFFSAFTASAQSASTLSGEVDQAFFMLVGVTAFFTIIIGFFVVIFSYKYRARANADRTPIKKSVLALEITWTVVPLMIAMFIFVWTATLFFKMKKAPPNTLDIYVVGKQWMWKVQQPNGKQEINELHVPLGKPVKLILTSKDVIHSFYIPAFRIKQDALPARYTTEWFEAKEKGVFHIFCAEYCGTSHSQMKGRLIVMDPADYESWLNENMPAVAVPGLTPTAAQKGEILFSRFACVTCHREDTGPRGPALDGLFGKEVVLDNKKTVTADEAYLRESFIQPSAKIVEGYSRLMPTYKDLMTEEEVSLLIEYIKSLK